MGVLAHAVVERDLFHQGVSQALHGAALELALRAGAMNDAAGVETGDQPAHAGAPGLLVDLDLERVRAERVVVERFALPGRGVDRRRRGRVVLLEHLDGPALADRGPDDGGQRERAIRGAADERTPAG